MYEYTHVYNKQYLPTHSTHSRHKLYLNPGTHMTISVTRGYIETTRGTILIEVYLDRQAAMEPIRLIKFVDPIQAIKFLYNGVRLGSLSTEQTVQRLSLLLRDYPTISITRELVHEIRNAKGMYNVVCMKTIHDPLDIYHTEYGDFLVIVLDDPCGGCPEYKIHYIR